MLTAILTGAALVAPLVAAQTRMPQPGDSFARCSFSGTGLAGSMSEEVASEVVGIASAYLCGNGTSTTRVARAAATEIAEATAFAITAASASCFATGNSRFTIRGRSAASAEAVAIAEAVIDVAGTVEVCGECSVAAALWARSYEEIIISASSVAELALNGSTTAGETLEVRASAFRAEFVSATADATADVLITLRGAVDEGCNATILADIGSDLNGVECNVSAAGSSDSISETTTNIAAAAGVSVAGKPCGVEVETFANVSVAQVARAMASAVAEVQASCIIAGDAYACALAEAEINATANATAFAFAAAYAEETESCGAEVCNLRLATLVSVCRTILIRSTSALYLQQCSGPDSFFNIAAFQETLTEVILEPFIEVIGQIQVISGRCSVTLPVFAVPGEDDDDDDSMGMGMEEIPTCEDTCAEDNKVCFGKNFDAPRACCSPDYVCIRRDEEFSQCRLNGRPGTFVEWDGREEVCIKR